MAGEIVDGMATAAQTFRSAGLADGLDDSFWALSVVDTDVADSP